MSMNVTPAELRRIIFTQKRPAMVLFTGSWCVDCMAFMPIWESWRKSKDIKALFVLEIKRGDVAWTEWNLREIPTVAGFADGEEKARSSDQITSDDLDRIWQIIETH